MVASPLEYFSLFFNMTAKNKIIHALFAAIDELNEIRPSDQALEKSSETVLFGAGGQLDSIGLVTFLVSAERNIAEIVGHPVTIADERAMSQRNSPFRTIDSLAEYIVSLLAEETR